MGKRARQMQKAAQAAKAAKIAAAAATSETIIIPLILLLANKKNAKRLLYVILGIVILIIIFFSGGFGTGDPTQDATVTLQKSAPPQVGNDEPITYALDVSYTGNLTQIIVTDPIPSNATFVSAGQNAQTLDASGAPTTDPAAVKTVKWVLNVSSGGGDTSSGTIVTGDNLPPNKDTCNGVYSNINSGDHNGDNYGDPGCTLATSARVSYDFTDPRTNKNYSWSGVPQALIDLLTQLDPQNVGYWIGIAACEAPGFDPNNRTLMVGDTHTPDAAGAWGLFQMGSHGPYTPGNGTNGQYDRGDVNWQNQVFNAVHDNRDRVIPSGNPAFRYYGCARDIFALWSD